MSWEGGVRRALGGLQARLLVAHLLVILVGVGTLYLAASLAAPRFFELHMSGVAGPSGMEPGRMGGMHAGGMPDQMGELIADAYRQALAEALMLAGAAALGTAIVASVLVSRQVARPIYRLAAATRRIARGHHAERVPRDGPQELAQLAANFNTMAAAVEGAERRRLELIGDVAHELRTPIATLEGYLEGLLDGVVEPSDRTWAKLHTEAGRLRRLVEDLQELSRAEAHQLAVAPRPVEPNSIAKAAVDRLTADFEAKGLELRLDLPPGLPPIQADPDRAIQVLTNLLTNALRYTSAPGRVVLTAGRTDGMVRFRVSDTGIGIEPEHLPHVFERFYRADKSRSRALGGAGVGLTIAQAFVEAMGGQIRAESGGAEQGATFSFDLPISARS